MAAPAEEEAGGGVSELCSLDCPGGEEAVTGALHFSDRRRGCGLSLRAAGPPRPGHEELGTPVSRLPPLCMADMAPALTGAAQEAPHRLKLSARGGLLLLNGGEKSRPAREDGRPEDAPGPKAGGQELRPGTLGKMHRERPLHGVKPMERMRAAPGPKERLGSSLGPGERTGALLGPKERLGSSPGPRERIGAKERLEATPGPGERTGAKERLGSSLGAKECLEATLGPGVRTGSILGPKQRLEATPGPGERTGSMLGPKQRLEATPEPRERTGAMLEPKERLGSSPPMVGHKERLGSSVGPGERSGTALGPKEHLGASVGSRERTGSVSEMKEQLGPVERTGAATGPRQRLGSAPGPGERTVLSQGPGARITGVSGLKRKSLEGLPPSERPVNASGSPVHSVSGHTFLQNLSVSASRPMALQDNSSRLEKLKGRHGRAEDSLGSAQGPTMISAPARDSVAGTLARQLGVSGLGASEGSVSGPSDHLDSALETPLDCVPASHTPQGSAPRPSSSQDAASGPKVLCALRAAQTSSRQQELGARARLLCRRLQVIQAKQVERHVRQQLSGLVDLLSERGPAGLPGSPHVELDRLASSSTARLRAAQGGFDSDATESSSGGESDTEEETAVSFASPEEERPEEELSQAQGSDRRAEWRWAVERAAIICRWTWLQAQVSDLEFRIRQQTEFYKQIRCTKGGVVLGESTPREDSTARQVAASSVVLNARGIRVPLSSSSQTTTKTPSGGEQCDGLPNTPTLPSQGSDKQCSRLAQSAENVACQNPATPVCESPASQKQSRQVNGLINCVRPSVACNGSAENLDPEGLLGKKRRMDAMSTSPALLDSTCVAARTRPLRGHKKRHLVRCSDVSSLSRKPQKQPSAKCGCEPPTTCIVCECKTYAKSPHPETLSERIALMDPCYHPILSLPYDTPLHLHFESLLKEDRQFRLSNKLKILKLSHLGKKPQERVRRDSFGQSLEFTGRSVFRDDRQHRGLSSPSIHVSSPFTPRPNPAAHLPPSLSETPPSSISQQNSSSAALKRKRFENSYDIDNIVIPMSLVAASRVEKLQYKEILTPSWCLLGSTEREIVNEDPELEDLSDETYQERHSKYEDLERSRWDSWTSALPQRRGSRSSNKSEGRWTPQPPSNSQGSQQSASPDVRFHSLNDGPLSLSSAASDNLEPYSTVQCLAVQSRTRVLSWSEDTRSSTPEVPDEEERTVQPWEHRFFPLSDRDYFSLHDLPVTPIKGKSPPHPDSLWQSSNNPGVQTESIDSGMSTEHLLPASKESPLPNSISVVRVRAHSGDKIASLEYLPVRPVNKR